MEVDFESSAEEDEDVPDLNIVISEVCSVLEKGAVRVVENPLFSEDTDTDSEDSDEDENVKDEDYVYVKESPEPIYTDLDNNYIEKEQEIDFHKEPTASNSAVRSRSVSSCVDVAPNQGLHDDHDVQSDEHGGNQEQSSEIVGRVGSLVWAKMKGYPPWPAIVVPDPQTGRSREVRKGKQGEWRHVLFLEYRNEVAWLHQEHLKVFSTKGSAKVKGRNKALAKAVELASNLSNMNCMDRIRSFTEYQQFQMKEEDRSSKGISVGQVWAKLSMEPVVKLKRVKVSLQPVVMLKRINVIESETVSDDSEYDTDDLLADSGDEYLQFTQVKPGTGLPPGGGEWCEGMLVWARVQGYPFWPAVIVREQRSEHFSNPSKGGRVRIHVMFLAYQKQTAWVGEASLVPFYEADQFKSFLISGSKKSQKDFIPTKTMANSHRKAVEIATQLLPKSLYNRQEYLYT